MIFGGARLHLSNNRVWAGEEVIMGFQHIRNNPETFSAENRSEWHGNSRGRLVNPNESHYCLVKVSGNRCVVRRINSIGCEKK